MKECYICGAKEDLQEHHIIPRSKGGENTKTITLCYSCHCKSHGRDSKGLDHSYLVSEGIKKKFVEDPKARSNWGNTKGVGLDKARAERTNKANEKASSLGSMVAILIEMGQSMNAIAKLFNSMELKTPSGRGTWSHASVSRVLKRYKKIKKDDK